MTNVRQLENHLLTPVKSGSVPTNLVFVDTETIAVPRPGRENVSDHILRCWCASSVRLARGSVKSCHMVQGVTADAFWEWLDERVNRKHPLWVFAHNLGFDLTILQAWQLVLDGDLVFIETRQDGTGEMGGTKRKLWEGTAVLEDPPTFLKCRWKRTGASVTFIDTLNYWPCSLRELGDSVGLPKLTMPAHDAPLADWYHYCRRDVRIIEEAVTGLCKMVVREDLGGLCQTAPSQAMLTYRRRFLPADQPIYLHADRQARALERSAYYGGMVRQLYDGRVVNGNGYLQAEANGSPKRPAVVGPVYVLDVRSFYPSIMATHEFPTRLTCRVDKPGLQWLRSLSQGTGVVARVRLDTIQDAFPVRVVRQEGGWHSTTFSPDNPLYRNLSGRTVQAVGRYWTTLAGPELHHALDRGVVTGVESACIYSLGRIFRDYVEYFWQMRQDAEKKGDSATAVLCKLWLNSLYGKFAQWSYVWERDNRQPAPIVFGEYSERAAGEMVPQLYRSIGFLAQKFRKREEHRHAFPAIAAYVTSYGRERMRRLIQIAGADQVLYTDTDSLHVLQYGYDLLKRQGLLSDTELGGLRLVQTCQTAEYRGVKDYTLDGTDVIAGVRSDATKTGDREWHQDRFSGLWHTLRSPRLDAVAVERVRVDYSGVQPIGQVRPDGTVLPLLLLE